MTRPTGSASGRLTGGHDPMRPVWSCVRCGQGWPCPGARAFLLTGYADDRVLLGMYLSTQLFTATSDLGLADVTPELLDRFLSWAQSTDLRNTCQ